MVASAYTQFDLPKLTFASNNFEWGLTLKKHDKQGGESSLGAQLSSVDKNASLDQVRNQLKTCQSVTGLSNAELTAVLSFRSGLDWLDNEEINGDISLDEKMRVSSFLVLIACAQRMVDLGHLPSDWIRKPISDLTTDNRTVFEEIVFDFKAVNEIARYLSGY